LHSYITPYTYHLYFNCSCAHRDLHSFPTRRSSDLFRSGAAPGPLITLLTAKTLVSPIRMLTYEAPLLGWPLTLARCLPGIRVMRDRKSTRLNSSHVSISYAVFCLKKKKFTYAAAVRIITMFFHVLHVIARAVLAIDPVSHTHAQTFLSQLAVVHA